jgi:hypothetical protein
MNRERIIDVLGAILAVLRSASELRWTRAIEGHLAAVEGAVPETSGYQEAMRAILALFGGMGSFQDLVLQDATGVLPEQTELASLRHHLFELCREDLQ